MLMRPTTCLFALLAAASLCCVLGLVHANEVPITEKHFGPYNYWYPCEEKEIGISRNWRAHLIETGIQHFKDSLVSPGKLTTRWFIKSLKLEEWQKKEISDTIEDMGVHLDNHDGVRVHNEEEGRLAAQKGQVAIYLRLENCSNELRPHTYGQHTTKNWQGGHVIKAIRAWGELVCKVSMTVYGPAKDAAQEGDL
jgi:hypothetical protein